MKAEISFTQLWMNRSLLSFFFTSQAEEELTDFITNHEYKGVSNTGELLEHMESICEQNDIDVDELCEYFHSLTHKMLVEEFELTEVTDEEEEDCK